MSGWLVNDCLTCIPGTKTFWHNLLDWIPDLEDKTFGYTDFGNLNSVLNEEAKNGKPDYIIRNGTFFGPLDIETKTISLIQDSYNNSLKDLQLEVADKSDAVVFNSPLTHELYKNDVDANKSHVISLGVDFDFFKPLNNKDELISELGLLPSSILFVGAPNNYPKGFDMLMDVVNTTNYNFCFVMKTDYSIDHPRIKVFNNVSHDKLLKIYNACSMLICTSRMETLHLAGVEAAACGLPLLTTNIGVYFNKPNGKWGQRAKTGFENIHYIMDNLETFNPRQVFLDDELDIKSCKEKWIKLVKELND